MSSKSKKIILETIIFAIIVIIVILLIVFTKKENNEQETIPIVQLSELLEIRNLEDVKYKTEKTEDDFVDLYYLKKDIDISQLTKQIEEVEEIKWFSKQEIDDMIKNGAFFKYHINEYNEFLKFLKGCDAK